jgi:hypothetical protein
MYRGKPYRHHIDMDTEGDDTEGAMSAELQQIFILSNSLITFVDDAAPMPIFPTKLTNRRENECMSEEVYLECKKLIGRWDTDETYSITGSEDGIISLERLKPSYCSLCDRVHETMGTFCYLGQAQLFWHCGHARGKGGILIGRVRSIKTASESFLEGLFAGLGNVIIKDEDDNIIGQTTKEKEYALPTISLNGVVVTDRPQTRLKGLFGADGLSRFKLPGVQPLVKMAPDKVEVVSVIKEVVTPPREQPRPKVCKVIDDELLLLPSIKEEELEPIPELTPPPKQQPKVVKPRKIIIKDPIKNARTVSRWSSPIIEPEIEETPQTETVKYSLKNRRQPRVITFS